MTCRLLIRVHLPNQVTGKKYLKEAITIAAESAVKRLTLAEMKKEVVK